MTICRDAPPKIKQPNSLYPREPSVVQLVINGRENPFPLRGIHRWGIHRSQPSLLNSPTPEDWWFYPFKSDFHHRKALHSHGISPAILYSDGNNMVDMVAAGFGVCIAHTASLTLLPPSVVVVPLNEPLATVRLVLVWLRDNKISMLDRFVDTARELKAGGQFV